MICRGLIFVIFGACAKGQTPSAINEEEISVAYRVPMDLDIIYCRCHIYVATKICKAY